MRFVRRWLPPKPAKLADGFEREATRLAWQASALPYKIHPDYVGSPLPFPGFGLFIAYLIVVRQIILLLAPTNVNFSINPKIRRC